MLVLTRRSLPDNDTSDSDLSEVVCRIPPSDKEQTIVVTKLADGRLGFSAPKNVAILRRELARQQWVDAGPEIEYGGEG